MAAKIIGETADVTRFPNESAFARFAGVGPIPMWSGSTEGRMRNSRTGNRQINSALHRIALTQIMKGGQAQSTTANASTLATHPRWRAGAETTPCTNRSPPTSQGQQAHNRWQERFRVGSGVTCVGARNRSSQALAATRNSTISHPNRGGPVRKSGIGCHRYSHLPVLWRRYGRHLTVSLPAF
jgi:Transposase IS116/IS110/IS902 family